jgi:hypothetical protein
MYNMYVFTKKKDRLQSDASYFLVAVYDIHGRKRAVLLFCSVSDYFLLTSSSESSRNSNFFLG